VRRSGRKEFVKIQKPMHLLRFFLLLNVAFLLFSCSVQQRLGRTAGKTILKAQGLKTAHVGISIFEPATNRYWYNYQGDHYFVPASNVKIPTCYAAMKYLGDSIVLLIQHSCTVLSKSNQCMTF
jgi:D-alanyl-D-alanine carboxypeptidase